MIDITCSVCFSVLNPIFQNMSLTRWTMFLFRIGIFLTIAPFEAYLRPKERQSQQDRHWINERYTYTSIWASSSSSRVFSHLGCHIGISKYFSRKGPTTFSRTRNRRYLLRNATWNKWYKSFNWNNWYKTHENNA